MATLQFLSCVLSFSLLPRLLAALCTFGTRTVADCVPSCWPGPSPVCKPAAGPCTAANMALNLKFKTVQGKQFELSFEDSTKVCSKR